MDSIAQAVLNDVQRSPDELVATDLVPVASAARYLEQRAASLLAPRRVRDRPIWLWGCRDWVYRRPWGVVGLIGTWNFPIFLNAIPILHAVVAGNSILWKPSEHAPQTAIRLHELFLKSGFPKDLIQLLPATRESGPILAESPIDFLHFTGSEAVGRKLAAKLGERLVPSTLELSGCDAMFVLKDADIAMAAKIAWYGAMLNSGQTCMAVRRVYVDRIVFASFVDQLRVLAKAARPVTLVLPGEFERRSRFVQEAEATGCEILPDRSNPIIILNIPGASNLASNQESLFAPLLTITPCDSIDEMLQHDALTKLRLTASIFTADRQLAQELAARLPVGNVTINDVIVPTAHPATPFGGRGASGWGVTQGAEGLLNMTVPQVVTVRAGTFRPHADSASSASIPRGYLRLVHGRGLRQRWSGFRELISGLRKSRPSSASSASSASIASSASSASSAIERPTV